MKRLRFFFRKLGINRKRPFLFGFLVLLCLGVTVGYAFLTTTLNINGAVNVASSRWDVHFENVQIKDGSVTATTAPTITDDTSIAFAATLENPGEFYEFTVDVVNDGTYDARISSLEITPNLTEDESKYFEYQVQYTTEFDLKEEDILLSGRRREIKIAVFYKTSADDSVYPEEDKDFNFEIIVNYEQLGKNYNPCTYEGELTNGASYQNGQYTYTYNTSNNGWSAGLINRSSTDPVTTKLCTSINEKYIVSMNGMFAGSRANSIDLSSFDTSHVMDMSGMFSPASNVKSLDFSSFDTSNVTNMASMFGGSSSLKSLNLSYFDTSNVTNMGNILSGTTQLESINFSGWDFSKFNIASSNSFRSAIFGNTDTNSTLKKLDYSNVIFGSNMKGAFGYFSSLESIKFQGIDTSRVTDMSYLFYGNSSFEELDLSMFDTSNVTNMTAMFLGLSNLKKLDLSGLDFRKTSALSGAVNGNYISQLQELDLSGCKFPSNMHNAFAGLSNLEILNINDVDTSIVTDMSQMFENDSKITSIDLSRWDFNNITSMGSMFRYCTSLKTANLDGAGSDNLSTISDIFYQDTNIEEISMKNFNFGTIVSLGNSDGPFNQKANLKRVDLSGSKMSKVYSLPSAFYGCSNLTTLNMSNINAPTEIGAAYYAFGNASSLTEIDLSSFTFKDSTDYSTMFSGVTATVGYAKTQADADILNSIPDKPSGLVFTVKS